MSALRKLQKAVALWAKYDVKVKLAEKALRSLPRVPRVTPTGCRIVSDTYIKRKLELYGSVGMARICRDDAAAACAKAAQRYLHDLEAS